jgi:hypothetical protein
VAGGQRCGFGGLDSTQSDPTQSAKGMQQKGELRSFGARSELFQLRRHSDAIPIEAGGDGLWYVVRPLRWVPVWKAFEKRCG